VAAVEAIRRALPPSGRPILPGHVTVKGTFVEPLDLEQIAGRIAACCRASEPFTLTTGAWVVREADGWSNAWLEVDACLPMTRLHDALMAALADQARTIYAADIEDVFRPHLTLAQQFPPGAADAARAVLASAPPQFTFPVTEIALVGRRGGTAWEPIRTFPLGRESAAT